MRLFASFVFLEMTIFLAPLSCGAELWKCANGDEIPAEYRCDDQNDCTDRSDETDCDDKVCLPVQFKCENNRCIDKSYVCDGESDCLYGDHSDESNCSVDDTLPSDADHVGGCANGKFKCAADGVCLSYTWVCDGERDCLDASDELNCPCKGSTFGCPVRGVSFCLRNATRCDGVEHCDDGEDEENCVSIKSKGGHFCPNGYYKCRTESQCVSWKMVCDGSEDCLDGSDEGGHCHVNDCSLDRNIQLPKKRCEHLCHETPDGAQCLCNEGFRLASDGVHCLDIDDCAEMLSAELHNSRKLARLYAYGLNRICSQDCFNVPGGFYCGCAEGYVLELDGFTCKAAGTYDPVLYVVIGSEIRVLSLRDPGHEGMYYETVYRSANPEESIVDLDVSVASSAIFWIERNTGTLNMKYSDDDDIATFNLDFKPNAVAVDWVTGNLLVSTLNKRGSSNADESPAVFLLVLKEEMFGDRKGKKISTIAVVELITGELQNPVSLAVCPRKGIMLVADHGSPSGSGGRLLVANLDGSGVRTLVSENVVGPIDVIIDDIQEAAIWASYNRVTSEAMVESVKLDGTQRGVIMSRKANWFPVEPVSTAVFEDHFYVSDRKAGEVRRWNSTRISLYGDQNLMRGSEGVIKLQENLEQLGTIKIVHPVLQPQLEGKNHCKSSGCSHACVMVQSLATNKVQQFRLSSRCLCPTNYKLSTDKKTCVVPPEKPHPVPNEKSSIQELPSTSTTTITTTTPTTTPTTTTAAAIYASEFHTTSMGPVVMFVCASPATVANSVMHSTVEYKGSVQTISYWCSKGYVMRNVSQERIKGEYKITCLPGGYWDPQPPQCVPRVRSTPKTIKEQSLSKFFGHVHDGVKDLLGKLNEPSTQEAQCAALLCEPWGNCTRNERGYECACPYGKTTTPTSRCLPPNKPTPDTTVAPKKGLPPFAVALIVITVLFVLFLVVYLCCRIMRKNHHSIDLRYFNSGKFQHLMSPLNNTDSEAEASGGTGTPASVTNPNYSSPSKRLRKPAFNDDKDSGIQHSSGSGSPTSTSDDNLLKGANQCTSWDEPASCLPLLVDTRGDNRDDDTISEISIDDLGKNRRSRLPGKLGLFKLRRTESRECMLPKQRFPRSSPTYD